MSVADAAGCALSSSQSVSVVPMIQCRPHGITNSTLVSVRRISPVSSCIRSRGTTRWMPFDARTLNLPRSPTRCWTSSVQTPVALITSRARDLDRRAGRRRRARARRSPARPRAGSRPRGRWTPPRRRIARRCGRRSACGGRRRPWRRSTGSRRPARPASARARSQRAAPGQVAVAGEALVAAERVVEHHPGADVGALPVLGQRQQERHRRDEVRREHVQQQRRARAAPRARARTRAARGSAARRG